MGLLAVIFVLVGCDNRADYSVPTRENDSLLAEVGSHQLYLSDIGGPPKTETPEDSIAIVNAYVQQWVTKMSVLDEAERAVSDDIDLQKLLADYKVSLLLHNFRSKIVERKLGTFINDMQLQEFYEATKEQYQLAEPILKGMIFKIHKENDALKEFDKVWKKEDIFEINRVGKREADFYESDTAKWYSQAEFFTYLPQELNEKSALKKVGQYKESHNDHYYYVKVIHTIDTTEDPPLSYIDDKLRKVIINKRKKELLDNEENRIYQRALKSKKIKVYTQ